MQETGSKFASIVSARTAIGHDRFGAVKIVQVDGASWQTGFALLSSHCNDLVRCSLPLHTFATMLIVEHQLVNAINIDGGWRTFAVVP